MIIKKLFSPLLIAAIALIGLLAFLNWPESENKGVQRSGPGKTPVVVYDVNSIQFPVVVEALGTARANEAVLLTSQQSDVIQSIHFDDGDVVEKGQLLLTMNDREEKARINELEINIQEAQRQLKRVTDLAKTSVASEQLLDEQQARVKALNAQLEVAHARLEELALRAPFAGKLGIRQVSVGAFITPSDSIATLDDLRQIKVDFNISENHLPSLLNGQKVNAVSVAYPDRVFNGAISTLDSRVDADTRSIRVRAIIDNPDYALRPGMLLQINLEKRVMNSLVVPEKSIIPNEDKQFVFVVENDKVVQREVQTGLRRPGMVQIISGLESGETVVVEGTLRLRNGSGVSVLSTVTL